MYHWLDEPRFAHEGVMVRTLWVTFILSLLLHLALLIFVIPRTRLFSPGEETPTTEDRLQVQLAAGSPPPPAPPPSRETPPPPARVIKAVPRVPPIAVPKAAVPSTPLPPLQAPTLQVPQPAPQVATPTPAPADADLSAYIQARRHERGLPDSPASGEERHNLNSAIAANLPAPAHGVAADPKRGGGIFEIKRMDYDDAAFEFFGWNPDMQRRTPQMIEVRKGSNADMRIAVVRSMIAIIRQYSKEDFVWRSPRHNRDYTLSARLSDNASLEDFLMHEFFDDPSQTPN